MRFKMTVEVSEATQISLWRSVPDVPDVPDVLHVPDATALHPFNCFIFSCKLLESRSAWETPALGPWIVEGRTRAERGPNLGPGAHVGRVCKVH